MRRLLSSILLIAVVTSSASAADQRPTPPAAAESIVVTASAIEEDPARTPAAVTILTSEDIEREKARDLATLMREVPGISISRSGTEGKQTSLFMRGGNSAHALVLWNGIEINNAYSGGFDWGQFSTAGIDRVEIVRGPWSAIYGSDAMAGVINVITSSPTDGYAASVELGERGLAGARFGGDWSSGNLVLDGAIDTRRDEGFHSNDDFEQLSALASLNWSGGRGFSAGVAARFNDFELGIPFNVSATGGEIVPSLERRQAGRELQIAIPLRQRLGDFEWDLTLSRADRTDEFSDPADPFGYSFGITDSTVDRVAVLTRTDTVVGTFVVGGEWELARVDDRSAFNGPGEWNLEGRERESSAAFVEHRLSRAVGRVGIEIAAGVRHDEYDTFGSHVSPRIAAAVLIGPGKLRTSWGEGFRAPSLTELYFPFSGNAALDPERSRTWEIGYDHSFSDSLTTGISFFDSDYDNLIVFDNATYAFANAGAADVRGVEVGLRWNVGPLYGAGSWTWLETERLATGRPLERRPKNSGSLSLGIRQGRFSSELSAIHSGDRLDVLPVFPYSLTGNEAWTTVDWTAEYAFGSIRPYIRVENLLNEKYQEVLGFPSATRRALIGARWTLK